MENQVDLNSVDEFHPLHYASLSNSIECASILISLGADPNYSPKNSNLAYKTPLFLAAHSGSSMIMNMIFDYNEKNKIKINMKFNTTGNPISESLRFGHIDCFRILIERGVRPTATLDQRDYSPLMIAIVHKELHEAVPILISSGDNLNTMTRFGNCPLSLACMMRDYPIVKMLCEDSSLKLDIKGRGDV